MVINRKRNVFVYLLWFVLVIGLGLSSRSRFIDQSTFIGEYSGDTLWGLMVFIGFCILLPKKSTSTICLISLSFAFAIEFSQLLQMDWLNELRQIKLIGLIVGYGFKLSDLVCYAVGIGAGELLDSLLFKRLK